MAEVRKHADRALQAASAYGRFPTPVDDVIAAARIEVEQDLSLDEGFLRRLYKGARAQVLRAVGKVLGLFDSRFRVIYLDTTVHPKKQLFVKLHEAGHGFLPWQCDLYKVLEDSDSSLDPDVKEAFEREANSFASEVMFQCGAFEGEAADHALELKTPLKLVRKYGSSVYAGIRRFVRTHGRACAVLVLDPPKMIPGDGFRAQLRRVEVSPAFTALFGEVCWPDHFTPADDVGALIPLVRKFSASRTCSFVDANGDEHICLAEAFNSTHQVFVLLCPSEGPGRVR